MTPRALDLPGPSRRIRVEPMRLPTPAREPVKPAREPAKPSPEPSEAPAPRRRPEREPAPA